MVDVGGVPMVATGGYGNGDCGWGGGGMLGLILILALFGGCGFGGLGRGHGCGDGIGSGHVENRIDYNCLREGQFGLQKDILENKYAAEKNTAFIIHNQDQNTCKILEKMSANELREAYAKIGELNTCLSEQRITGTILASLQPPRAIPAYPAPNPYVPFYERNCYPQGCC